MVTSSRSTLPAALGGGGGGTVTMTILVLLLTLAIVDGQRVAVGSDALSWLLLVQQQQHQQKQQQQNLWTDAVNYRYPSGEQNLLKIKHAFVYTGVKLQY